MRNKNWEIFSQACIKNDAAEIHFPGKHLNYNTVNEKPIEIRYYFVSKKLQVIHSLCNHRNQEQHGTSSMPSSFDKQQEFLRYYIIKDEQFLPAQLVDFF